MPDFQAVQTDRIQYIAVVGSILLLGFLFELIRRRKLREEYALIWIAAAVVALFFSIWRSGFDAFAGMLGIAYGPALLILFILFFGFLLLVHFSIVISRLTTENKKLAQEIALLANRLDEIKTPDGSGE